MTDQVGPEAVQLVDSGRAKAEIIWWVDESSPVGLFASEELSDYVHEIAGVSLDTIEGLTDTATEAVVSAVVVVPTGTVRDRSLSTDLPTVRSDWLESVDETLIGRRPDSFTVTTVGDAVVCAGTTDRGTLYAVYELLEQLGVRFFAPDFEFYEDHAEHVPFRESISVSPLDIVEEPSLMYRRKDVAEGRSHTSRTINEMVDWMGKTRCNVLATPANFTNLGLGVVTWDSWRDVVVPELEKRGMILETGGHGFDAFLPPSEYREAHPEWFVEGYNVFDVTNEKAVQMYVENTIEYLASHPEIDVFDAWPPDGADWPPRVAEEFGSIANGYAHVINELTAAVRERLSERDIRIEAIAYASHIEVPDSEYMYDNDTIIDFAPFDRSYTELIFESDSGMNREYVELMERWRDAYDGPLSTYEYYRKYSWHSLPVVLPELIGQEIPFYESIGLDGLWIYSEPADWIPYELIHSQVAALMWDTDLDTESYVESYLRERYGATDEMGVYLERVENAGRTLFDSFRGNYDDETAISEALEDYRQAADALEDANASVADGSTAAFLLERLTKNIEFALADTEISYHELHNHDDAKEQAKKQAREVLEKHYLDGILLKSTWICRRCESEQESDNVAEMIEEYRKAWGG